MSDHHPECSCLATAPKHPNAVEERSVGIDPSNGRFADVTLVRCALCRRLWLTYQFEIEAFTASGRWYAALISEADAKIMTPHRAPDFIKSQPWRIYGGSFYGHSGRRGSGPIRWD